jgi:hypothetical protein
MTSYVEQTKNGTVADQSERCANDVRNIIVHQTMEKISIYCFRGKSFLFWTNDWWISWFGAYEKKIQKYREVHNSQENNLNPNFLIWTSIHSHIL